jgi:hypothetical protein
MSKVFEDIFEFFAWLRILLSPLAIGCFLGWVIYINIPDTTGLILGVVVAVLGLIVGIVWATRVWKKQGTMHFISRISASEDLDPKEKPEKK